MATSNNSTDVLKGQETEVTEPESLPMAHHNGLPDSKGIHYKKGISIEKGYGVPPKQRILTIGVYHKRFDQIRNYLLGLGLENRERDAVFGLLRLYIYYGKVYPKAQGIADDNGISRRTFWRAIAKLRNLELVEVINRYFNHKQISNLYRLDKLVLMIARYLAERGQELSKFAVKLVTLFSSFWRDIWEAEVDLSHIAPVKLKPLVRERRS